MSRFEYFGGSSDDKYAPLVEEWFKTQAKAAIDRKKYAYWIIMNGDGACGAIVYCDITKNSATLHIHAPKCLIKNTIKLMFDYPFNQLGVKKLFAPIHSANEKAQYNAAKLGFKIEGRAKDYYDIGNDLVLHYCERKDIEKWLN